MDSHKFHAFLPGLKQSEKTPVSKAKPESKKQAGTVQIRISFPRSGVSESAMTIETNAKVTAKLLNKARTLCSTGETGRSERFIEEKFAQS